MIVLERRAIAAEEAAHVGCGDEREGHEQKAAAQEDRGEETVLGIAQMVPDHPDEPEERDPGVRDHQHRERKVIRVGIQPGAGSDVVGAANREGHERHGRAVPEGERDAGNRRRAGCFEPLPCKVHSLFGRSFIHRRHRCPSPSSTLSVRVHPIYTSLRADRRMTARNRVFGQLRPSRPRDVRSH